MSFFYKHLPNILKYSPEIFQVPTVSLRVPNLENKKVAHVWVFIFLQNPPMATYQTTFFPERSSKIANCTKH